MSNRFETGSEIPLSANLFKNNQAQSGQILNVSVFDIFGNELLAETPVPETIKAGQYTFIWNNPPKQSIRARAYYNWTNQLTTMTEEIIITARPREGVSKLTGIISNQKLVGDVKENNKLSGNISDRKIFGDVKEKSKLVGDIKNKKLIGNITGVQNE